MGDLISGGKLFSIGFVIKIDNDSFVQNVNILGGLLHLQTRQIQIIITQMNYSKS